MKTLLSALFAGAILLEAGAAGAGLQPNAVAKLQWYNDATCSVHSGNYNPLTEPQGFTEPTFLVSASGLSAFRGADVQIVTEGLTADGQATAPLPASWQVQTGGCAKPRLSVSMSSAFTKCFASAWNDILGLATSQSGMYYNINTCITPAGIGVFWFESAGAEGSNTPLDPSVEYGLYSVTVAQINTATSACAGNSTHGASPVCFYAWYRIPCQDVVRGAVFAALDANDEIDYSPFAPGLHSLTYNSVSGAVCPSPTRAVSTTWGHVRRMYH